MIKYSAAASSSHVAEWVAMVKMIKKTSFVGAALTLYEENTEVERIESFERANTPDSLY